jgi:hypothetical protein
MFRVDPNFKYPSIAFQTVGENYDFLQLTKSRPVWILHASCVQEDEKRPEDRRYMFASLLSAIELACDLRWVEKTLYIMLPEHMTSSKRLVVSAVVAVWLCKLTRGDDDLCFEVTTESAGVHFLTPTGLPTRQAKRGDPVWPPRFSGAI